MIANLSRRALWRCDLAVEARVNGRALYLEITYSACRWWHHCALMKQETLRRVPRPLSQPRRLHGGPIRPDTRDLTDMPRPQNTVCAFQCSIFKVAATKILQSWVFCSFQYTDLTHFLIRTYKEHDVRHAPQSELNTMTTFAEILPVKQLESHKYSVNLEDDWCIGTGMNYEGELDNVLTESSPQWRICNLCVYVGSIQTHANDTHEGQSKTCHKSAS